MERLAHDSTRYHASLLNTDIYHRQSAIAMLTFWNSNKHVENRHFYQSAFAALFIKRAAHPLVGRAARMFRDQLLQGASYHRGIS